MVFVPVIVSYPSVGAWFSRTTTSCASIAAPNRFFFSVPAFPTSAHVW